MVELDCPRYSAQASMSIGAEENQVLFHFNRNLDVSWKSPVSLPLLTCARFVGEVKLWLEALWMSCFNTRVGLGCRMKLRGGAYTLDLGLGMYACVEISQGRRRYIFFSPFNSFGQIGIDSGGLLRLRSEV